MTKLLYTNILHEPRRMWELSLSEYVICDMVYHLSNNRKYQWCIMSKETMAQEIGVTKKTVLNTIKKMIEKGFIEKDEATKFLRTTEKWYSNFVTTGEKITPTEKKEENIGEKITPPLGKKLHQAGEKITPNINKDINSNINKNKYFQDSKINDLFLLFIENRKQMRKKMTDIAIDRMQKKIEGWIKKHGSEKVAGFINTSIENGWQGIFEKEDPKKPEKMAYETTERGNFTF